MASRTRELRRAAAVMDWKTIPLSDEQRESLMVKRLPPPPTLPAEFSDYDASPREPRRYDCGHAKPRGVKLSGWFHLCRGCDRFERRKTRHWLVYGFTWLVLMFTTCSARASSSEPCAPYSPADGKSCRKPTQLGFMADVPVCYCPSPRVAAR